MDIVRNAPSSVDCIYVLFHSQGTTGKLVPNYPLKLKGRIQSQVLLLDGVGGGTGGKGLLLVVHSLDGHVYIIEGPSGCADKIDIGEPSYLFLTSILIMLTFCMNSMVLADDLTGNGFVDLLVTTRSGNIYCLGTTIPFHPLKAWYLLSSFFFISNYNAGFLRTRIAMFILWVNIEVFFALFYRLLFNYSKGIFVLEQSRQFRDITGNHFFVSFEIVDNSWKSNSYYVVEVWLCDTFL